MHILQTILSELDALRDNITGHIADHEAALRDAAAGTPPAPTATSGTHPDALAANGAMPAAAIAAQVVAAPTTPLAPPADPAPALAELPAAPALDTAGQDDGTRADLAVTGTPLVGEPAPGSVQVELPAVTVDGEPVVPGNAAPEPDAPGATPGEPHPAA